MAQYCILGKRINKLSIPKTYDINKIQLGVVVIENEAKKVGLAEVGANYAQTECQFRYCGTAIPFLTVRSTAR